MCSCIALVPRICLFNKRKVWLQPAPDVLVQAPSTRSRQLNYMVRRALAQCRTTALFTWLESFSFWWLEHNNDFVTAIFLLLLSIPGGCNKHSDVAITSLACTEGSHLGHSCLIEDQSTEHTCKDLVSM